MNTLIPDLEQFQIEELGQTPVVNNPNSEVSFKVDIEPFRITRRFVVGILDESKKRGIAIAIYPATGEVCDVTNGGGVIGYLSAAPLNPGVSLPCELRLYRFGMNFVCSVWVRGEIFLYPAFSMDGNTRLTAFVGQESDSRGANLSWSRLQLNVMDRPAAA
jgi:hypothetical protein